MPELGQLSNKKSFKDSWKSSEMDLFLFQVAENSIILDLEKQS